MRLLAKIISRIFDPFIEVPIILALLVPMAVGNGYRWRFFGLMFLLDALLPGLIVVYAWLKRERRDWDIHDREVRIPLYILTVVCHAYTVLVAYLINRQPLATILFGIWLVLVAFTLINWHYKLSLHMGVNTILLYLLTVFAQLPLGWWVILPLIGWARIVDRDHSLSQVLVGSAVPLFILSAWFWRNGIG